MSLSVGVYVELHTSREMLTYSPPPPHHIRIFPLPSISQFQSLMKKATAQTQSTQREAAELMAQRDAAQRKARLEQEARETKDREARKKQLLHDLEVKKKAEEEVARKEQREKDRQQSEVERQRESFSWAASLANSKPKSGQSAPNRAVKQLQEGSDKSRVSRLFEQFIQKLIHHSDIS